MSREFGRKAIINLTIPLTVCLWILLLSSLSSGRSSSGSVFVAWDPSPEPEVVGYRVHFGVESGAYTTSIDVGSITEAELTGLEPLRIHYCAVTAYDADGFESEFSDELPVFYTPFGSPTSEDQDGGGIVIIDPGLGSAPANRSNAFTSETLEVEFNADGGDYFAWARVRYPQDASSLSVSVDSTEVGRFSLPGEGESIESASQSGWTWSRLVSTQGESSIFNIPAGQHTLEISGIEDGVSIDRLVLSQSADFTPTDAIPRSGDAVSIVRQPGAEVEAVEGEPLGLEIEVVATGPTRFQWFKDGYLLENQTQPNLTISEIEPEDSGFYTALVSSGQASAATTRTAVVIVDTAFEVSRMTISAGNTVEFEVVGKPGAIISVFGSDNLKDWSLVAIQENTTGTIAIVDPDSQGKRRRFYRLEAP